LTNLGLMVGTISLNLNTLREMTLAIPINLYHEIKEEALAGRPRSRPPRPWLGIYTEEADNAVVVVQTVPDGPANRAGVRARDVIMAVDGREVSTRREFYQQMWKRAAGDELCLTVLREKDLATIRATAMDRAEFYAPV